MEISVKSGNPEKQRTACIVLGVYQTRKLTHSAEEVDKASNGYLSSLIRRGDMEGELGQHLMLHNVPNTLCDRVLLVGCGKERKLNESVYKTIQADCAKRLDQSGASEAVSFLTELHVKTRETHWKVRTAAEESQKALYRFDQLKSHKNPPRRPLKKITFSVPSRRNLSDGEEAVREAMAIASGIHFARDLGNMPANVCTPDYLAKQAQQLSQQYPGIKTQIIEESEMEQLGMGAFLSVSRGSSEPAKLIVMEYLNGTDGDKPVVLVGKGVTFDSGGISLKSGAGMDEMKFDMCGAASVFGTLRCIAELQLPINLVCVVGATENMPGPDATRPGDIVTTMSGQTVEILNTDAEGRLVLCDALTYVEKYEPDVVIDIATLTGACIVALGHEPSGLFSNHSPLANDLQNAGKTSGDRCWELPLWDEYQEQLQSNFADMANIGGRSAGSITAACFLSRFSKKFHWAHLDIAGTAWHSGKNKGATGRPVGLLSQYLLDYQQDKKA